MPESFTPIPGGTAPAQGTAPAAALAAAAAAIARLDQALDHHPLQPALLYRARLEAVRRQAAVDGQAIDPWHLAALLENLRPRLAGPRIIDRGSIFEAGRHALALHQWLVNPTPTQHTAIRQAEHCLAQHARTATPLLAAAHALHAWLSHQGSGGPHGDSDLGGGGWAGGGGDTQEPGHGDQGPGPGGDAAASGGPRRPARHARAPEGARAPMRAALVRFWLRHGLLHTPVPLTGAAALRPGTPWELSAWAPAFLHALAGEADDARQLLLALERGWFAARAAVAGRRKNSRAAAAIDLMAATPLVSATSLAQGLGMATNNAAALLEQFGAAGLAVEVTHRAARRLYALAGPIEVTGVAGPAGVAGVAGPAGATGLAPLRDQVAPPRRKLPGRGRGRPPLPAADRLEPPPGASPPGVPPQGPVPTQGPLPPLGPAPPLGPLERRAFDYSELDAAMAQAEQTIRRTRQALDRLAPAPELPIERGRPGLA